MPLPVYNMQAAVPSISAWTDWQVGSAGLTLILTMQSLGGGVPNGPVTGCSTCHITPAQPRLSCTHCCKQSGTYLSFWCMLSIFLQLHEGRKAKPKSSRLAILLCVDAATMQASRSVTQAQAASTGADSHESFSMPACLPRSVRCIHIRAFHMGQGGMRGQHVLVSDAQSQ